MLAFIMVEFALRLQSFDLKLVHRPLHGCMFVCVSIHSYKLVYPLLVVIDVSGDAIVVDPYYA